MPEITFDYAQTRFRLSSPGKTSAWIEKVVKSEGSSVNSLSYIFCTDKYLLGINQEYLDHDTLTDIITFEYSDSRKEIEGEIYISVPRVRENARTLGTDFDSELHRVIIHGVLHLLGYKDKSVSAKKLMRQMEDKYLAIR